MKFVCYIIGVCIIYCCVSGCNGDQVQKNSNTKDNLMGNVLVENYNKTILKIENKFGQSETWENLFLDSTFLYLYEHSSYFTDSAIAFMSDEKYTNNQKIICVFSMQRASNVDYIKFLTACENLFDENKLNENVIKQSVAPSFGKRRIVIKNYNNPSVRLILQKILKNKSLSSSFKQLLENIISGKTWEGLKKFNEENGVSIDEI